MSSYAMLYSRVSMADRPTSFSQWFNHFIYGSTASKEKKARPLAAETDSERIAVLTRQLEEEKRRNSQLALLNELDQQLFARLDQPVVARTVTDTPCLMDALPVIQFHQKR